jgi:hypothetical protein
MRYSIARFVYRLRFAHGDLRQCDFRPHFDGHLVNAHVTIKPQATAEQTRELAYHRWIQMIKWLGVLRWLFGPGDRIQMVVGLRRPPRQLLKGWVLANRLRDCDPLNLSASDGALREMAEWDSSVTLDWQGREA